MADGLEGLIITPRAREEVFTPEKTASIFEVDSGGVLKTVSDAFNTGLDTFERFLDFKFRQDLREATTDQAAAAATGSPRTTSVLPGLDLTTLIVIGALGAGIILLAR